MQTIQYYAQEAGISPIFAVAVSYCESGLSTISVGLNKKDGKVWSKDIGLFQLNDFYHKEEALKMGYDIYNSIDNIKFAMILIGKNGRNDYLASAKCISNYSGQGFEET